MQHDLDSGISTKPQRDNERDNQCVLMAVHDVSHIIPENGLPGSAPDPDVRQRDRLISHPSQKDCVEDAEGILCLLQTDQRLVEYCRKKAPEQAADQRLEGTTHHDLRPPKKREHVRPWQKRVASNGHTAPSVAPRVLRSGCRGSASLIHCILIQEERQGVLVAQG